MNFPNQKYLDEFFIIWKQAESKEQLLLNTGFDTTLLDNYAEQNNQFINIYSLRQHKVVYMSNNFSKVLGYDCSKADYEKWAAYYWLRDLPISQSVFFLKFSYFYQTQIRKLLKNNDEPINFYMHNFKLKLSEKKEKHLGLTCTSLELDNDRNLDKILIINSDISPLIKKNDCWWMDLKYNGLNFSYHQEDSKIKSKSFFSNREMNILKLIDGGLKNKEIAEQLEISPSTVEKHRNNLLEYTGTKDISSLLEILRLANML